MKVHHLNCISTCPLGGKLMDGGAESIIQRGHLTSHCLLIETQSELVLVDTGMGLKEVHDPHSRISEFFLQLLRPDFREEMTAYKQIERLGLDPKDVRHIILTHLDFDHAGGLDDFPWARVHMLQSEKDSAFKQKSWLDRQRYRPQQWGTHKNWLFYNAEDGESWYGLEKVRTLDGLPSEIAMIPLIGHTLGHAGVAVDTNDKWLFNTGDAYFYHEEMNLQKPCCTPGLTFYQNMMDKDRKLRIWNQERLRELKRAHPLKIELFCSHDLLEFEKLSGRSAEVPAQEMLLRNDRRLTP